MIDAATAHDLEILGALHLLGFRIIEGAGEADTVKTVLWDAVDHARQYAYRDRRQRKRQFRALWIARINAAAREQGMTYSVFMNGLKRR